jgi:leader peptidase (prepilin peptidase) / N-methyltransferase
MFLSGVQWLDASLVGLLGLLIGSFLNVVVYRLPKMLEQQWKAEASEILAQPLPEPEPFNLAVPRSRCPHCGHAISWYENIPVLSYLALGGKCSACKAAISLRYPLVELTVAALFFYCTWVHGANASGLVWCAFSAVLVAAALIDWDTTLLPDDLTLPLLWLGLVAAALRWIPVTLEASLWGAVGGYMSLWLVYWGFKLATGKEGMGYGDFKLFAALGAWFGWQTLIPIILLASVIGALVGIAMKLKASLREGGYVPFGPFLAGAGFAALVCGPAALRQAIGL